MANKKETKIKEIEREYIIPLRRKYQKVPRYKKTPKAIRTIKVFLAKHMKIKDRDLNKVKLDSYVNEYIWARGIKNPPHKIKIRAIKEKIGEDEIIKVELVDYPKNLKFKKARQERKAKESETSKQKKIDKKEAEKKPEQDEKATEEHKKEEAEKKSSVVEATEKIEKLASKTQKHQTDISGKQQKHQFRQALQK